MTVCASCGHESAQPFKFCPECGASAAEEAHPREQRKTVTVLFCDVAGSTALGESTDPEALRALLARYFERMQGIVESHGGSVEKFIGDAVMAVFGVPAVHEDDALRAVRAAVEMREALPELGLQARIGVNTGEVVTGTEERLATGDAVNVAARLEQAAAPGEVLVGEGTMRLVRDLVEAQPIEALELKGKSEPVPAYRLNAIRSAAERRVETPMVGRETDLRRLRDAFAQAVRDRSCQLFTVLGAAGVGKSRLAGEFMQALTEGRVVRGRCLSYGEGITYWPVVEVVKQLDALPSEEAPAAAIRSLLGESEAATSAEEIAWAFRKLLEESAREQPLVCVLDDLHWGEETFLDLVEHVADLARDAPLLLLCMARPELLERRPGWGGGKWNATTVLLEPLDGDETEQLLEAIGGVDDELRARIRQASEGNPLFVEEMIALVRESGGGEVEIPPTIQALLAARLDQLEPGERSVLERGAVEGRIFHHSAVQALSDGEPQLHKLLMALVRKELVRPDLAQLPGDDAYRFRHLLIRDAAYDALPKAARAELHERFASWLEAHGAELVELDEILGYHLEQAHRYRAELGMAHDDELAARARGRLTAAGRRAYVRADYGAAVSLLERAAALVPPAEIDLALESDLAGALFERGRGAEALRRTDSLAERAAAAGDRVGELCGRIQEGLFRVYLEPEGATERLAAVLEQALPVFEAAGDDLALYIGYSALARVANMRGQWAAVLEAFERALVHGQQAGLPHDLFLGWRAAARYYGTTPAPELLAWLHEQGEGGVRDPWLRAYGGVALAMLGRFDEARTLHAEVRAELAERGGGILLGATTGQESVDVELLAGDPAAAAELGAEGCRLLDELGEKGFLSTTAGKLAQALYALDRLEEADAWAGRAAELGASDDAMTQMIWRQVRAKVLAHRGEHGDAERIAREAVAIAEDTEWLNGQGDVYADLAEVLALANRPKEATEALEQALALYERKGNLVMAGRTRERLQELAPR
jgi:class 3 adenylate cyclase/tetratricopeptide (TPR) repeat protein